MRTSGSLTSESIPRAHGLGQARTSLPLLVSAWALGVLEARRRCAAALASRPPDWLPPDELEMARRGELGPIARQRLLEAGRARIARERRCAVASAILQTARSWHARVARSRRAPRRVGRPAPRAVLGAPRGSPPAGDDGGPSSDDPPALASSGLATGGGS